MSVNYNQLKFQSTFTKKTDILENVCVGGEDSNMNERLQKENSWYSTNKKSNTRHNLVARFGDILINCQSIVCCFKSLDVEQLIGRLRGLQKYFIAEFQAKKPC